MRRYTTKHARAGINAVLPAIECWENQYPGYEVEIVIPEYTAICPKTGLPDFGVIYINYVPDQWCLELKSLKEYVTAYRSIGIFYENAVNRILRDLVAACHPIRMKVRGEFTPRGGIQSRVEALCPLPDPKSSGMNTPPAERVVSGSLPERGRRLNANIEYRTRNIKPQK